MAFIINYDHCLCCGSVAFSKVFTCTDFTVTTEQFEVWQCNTCTFRFTQNAPAETYIAPYYQSAQYVSHSDTNKGIINKLYHLVRSFTLKTKRRLLIKSTRLKKGDLLDVGAGTGAFANTMKNAGWNVTGLEPDEVAREKAESNYGLTLGELSNLAHLSPASYDAITLWHVLEHVHDLHGYLGKFYEILKPGGKLVVAVPNYTSYDAQFYKEKWAAYDVPRHLYHFSPKSMAILLKKKNFTLEKIKPMWFDSFYVSMLSEKNKKGYTNLLRAFWIGMVSNLKAGLSGKRSSSVIYIISKKNR